MTDVDSFSRHVIFPPHRDGRGAAPRPPLISPVPAGRAELCHKHYQEMLKLKPFCNKEQLDIIRNAEDAMKGVKLL